MRNSKKAVMVGLVLSSASNLVLAEPFAAEGRLSQVNVDITAVGTTVNHVVCNSSKIYLGPNTVYTTPTGTITPAQFI